MIGSDFLNKRRIGIACIFVTSMIVADQISKQWVVQNINLYERISLIPSFLYITYIQNTGAGFSILEGFGVLFFTLITLIASGFIVYYYLKSEQLAMRISLLMILAGAWGNCLDRLLYGYVRDFIGVYILGWPFPIFNGADICITCGFILLIIITFWEERKGKQRWKENK
jgi:signal peptidase II